MAEAQVNGIRLHYEVAGEGPPLLLISGLGQHSGAWAPVLPELRARFRCITFDNRGTGRSEVPPGPYSIDTMADDAAALVELLGVGPVAAVGWSLGGSVLQSMLIRHGTRLSRAVLLSAFPAYTGVQHAWLDSLLALARSNAPPLARALFGMPWGFTPRVLCDHSALLATAQQAVDGDRYPTSIEGLEAQAHGLRRYDSRAVLPKVATPTLVLVGAEDTLTPVDQSIEMAGLIPGARLQVLPRGGHAMLLEYAPDVLGAITAFLERDL